MRTEQDRVFEADQARVDCIRTGQTGESKRGEGTAPLRYLHVLSLLGHRLDQAREDLREHSAHDGHPQRPEHLPAAARRHGSADGQHSAGRRGRRPPEDAQLPQLAAYTVGRERPSHTHTHTRQLLQLAAIPTSSGQVTYVHTITHRERATSPGEQSSAGPCERDESECRSCVKSSITNAVS